MQREWLGFHLKSIAGGICRFHVVMHEYVNKRSGREQCRPINISMLQYILVQLSWHFLERGKQRPLL